MTKEEYKRLLQSDYWKGYSYSLIKERNFTCEDCGRKFENERNKLQVHHLVYRDVNPWSYNPDEVVVLCEECHKKRHGIATAPEQDASYTQTSFEGYDNKYSFSTDSTAENPFHSRTTNTFNDSSRSPFPIEPEPKSRFQFKYVLYGLLVFLCIMIGRDLFFKQKPLNSNRASYNRKEQPIKEESTTTVQTKVQELKTTKTIKSKKTEASVVNTPTILSEDETIQGEEKLRTETKPVQTENAVVVAQKASERKEPSHELSTLDILEKKNHEEVVRQAKRAGVSTEGSTIDIMERINHAEVVKQAKRAGVSTEGTTLEILERINRKEMEKYNY